ncbi:hypothetical protein KHP07_19360 [Pseudomonas sp. VS40]|uniref:hypothetical protein n=1 Tax=unclassified Pseudomonas TaxID=196821 RepID=UPI001BDF5258|nr:MULTISPECIES: hypothetical protein [unclassified Pseudomonas]MBT1262532.1 hypothetical protein [Pseudomonas sp. VS40]MBT1274531.1 hypothetical protein [Pseudomonas sp. VS59]
MLNGDNWSGFFSVVTAIWEWFERVFVGLWSGLGWPHVALIMFLITVYFFKNEVKNILPRIKSFSASGFEVESPQPQIQPSTSQGEIRVFPDGEFPHSYGIVLGIVQQQLASKSDQEKLNFLLSDDVGWRVLWYFENIYSFIFGGQIQFLELLNQRGVTGVSLGETHREWEALKARNSPHMDDWEMEPYLGFLIAKELVVVEGQDIKLTMTGKEFLVWMTKNGRSPNRLW